MARIPRTMIPRTSAILASPVQQAERARQVVAVIRRVEDRLVDGRRDDGNGRGPEHLSRAIDATLTTDESDLAAAVVRELARDLPAPLRPLGRYRPRWALTLYGDVNGDRHQTLDLVRATHRRLGGTPRHPSAQARLP